VKTKTSIPFARPTIGDSEKQAVLEVLDGDVLTHGPQNKAFEQEFSAFMGGSAHAVTTSSCMAALHLACWQLGFGPGDEVLVPAQTHTATVHAVELVGAKPVFVDCNEQDGNMDVSVLRKKISPKTRGLIVVHFLGIPCPMDEVMQIADKHSLRVIEDCALAVGTYHQDKHAGLWGDAGCFSFYPAKHITTGEGGMFVTKHKDLAEKVTKVRGFGVDRKFEERKIPGIYDVPQLGLNYRMSEINAAIGRKQIERLPEILATRKRNFSRLKAQILSILGVHVPDIHFNHGKSSHYCLSAILPEKIRSHRNDLVLELNASGIGTSVYYPQPVPRMTYYRNKYGYEAAHYPIAELISDASIALPVGPHLGEAEIDEIAGTFKEVVERHL